MKNYKYKLTKKGKLIVFAGALGITTSLALGGVAIYNSAIDYTKEVTLVAGTLSYYQSNEINNNIITQYEEYSNEIVSMDPYNEFLCNDNIQRTPSFESSEVNNIVIAMDPVENIDFWSDDISLQQFQNEELRTEDSLIITDIRMPRVLETEIDFIPNLDVTAQENILESASIVHNYINQNGYSHRVQKNSLTFEGLAEVRYINCAEYVSWTLYEAGIGNQTELINSSSKLYRHLYENDFDRIESFSDLEPGDIIFMSTRRSGRNRIGHVQIYAGDGLHFNAGSDGFIRSENPGEAAEHESAERRFVVALRAPQLNPNLEQEAAQLVLTRD